LLNHSQQGVRISRPFVGLDARLVPQFIGRDGAAGDASAEELIRSNGGFMRSRTVKILSIPLLLGTLSGCAGITDPRQSVDTPLQRALAARTQAVENARASFLAAKASGCEVAAPFEYYMAQEYLRLAEKELAEGDKQHVFLFAENSKTHSTNALEMAKGGTK